jgi:hypothetical protein
LKQMKRMLMVSGMVLMACHAMAQLPGNVKTPTVPAVAAPTVTAPAVAAPTAAMPNVGNLLGQFTGAIQPAAFTDAWAGGGRDNFMGSLGNITSGAGLGKSIGSLVGFLRPNQFRKGFNLQGLLNTARTVTTMVQAVGLLRNLEGGLQPSAFSNGWTGQRQGWMSALNLIR